MTTSWNLAWLREYSNHNKSIRNRVNQLLNSIDNCVNIFRFHLWAAKDDMNQFFVDGDRAEIEHFELLVGVSERSHEFESAKIAKQANIIAACHSVRALYDLFSQLIRILILEDKIKEQDCNIARVRNQLSDGELKSYICQLLDSQSYQYIEAFINVTKHRYLLQAGTQLSTIDNKITFRFMPFRYRGKDYPSHSSTEVLELVLDAKNELIKAGRLLNSSLAADSKQL